MNIDCFESVIAHAEGDANSYIRAMKSVYNLHGLSVPQIEERIRKAFTEGFLRCREVMVTTPNDEEGASTPAISFLADTDTGIHDASANTVKGDDS